MTSVESIREKFKTGEYSVDQLPTLLVVDYNGDVFVHPDIPNPDIADEQEQWNKHTSIKELVQFPKLRATSVKQFKFTATKVPSDYFESRDSFEELIIAREDREVNSICIKAENILLRDAIKAMKVNMSANMDFYLKNKTELIADLGREISCDLGAGDELLQRTVEQELFYKIMCRIFGEESSDDKAKIDGDKILYDKCYLIKDFSILSFDGNSIFAAARRANNYLQFTFDY